MIRITTTLLAVLISTQIFSQQITFTGRILGCPEATKLYIFELNGLAAKPIAEAVATPGAPDTYQFTLPGGTPKIYGLGLDQENVMHIILGKESGFTVWGNCEKMPFARTVGSEANTKLDGALKEIRTSNELLATAREDYRAQQAQGKDLTSPLERIAATDITKKQALDRAQNFGKIQGAVAGLATQFSYEKNHTGSETEAAYLNRVFFNHVNLSDPILNEIPQVYQAFKSFIEELGRAPGAGATMQKVLDDKLRQIPDGSSAYRLALGGAISGLKTLNSPLFFDYASSYITKYKAHDNGEVARLDAELNKNRTFIPGMEAPDLVGPTPEGVQYSLKQMRGKVVLIDFWASWCGPCRRENPNVKLAYEKYKDQGFDILGVSLDQTKEAWVNAIAQDGLPWHHISDLKGWRSEHAALYSVSSIPQTLLIDRNGKIIERNLRGPALEEKLKAIFE